MSETTEIRKGFFRGLGCIGAGCGVIAILVGLWITYAIYLAVTEG